MKDLEKFINIFEGLDIAYGITKKSDEINEKGKNVTKSFTITKTPIKSLWQDHLDGKDPGLGIIPINQKNKLKWGCIDVDKYPVNHKEFIDILKRKNIKAIVFRSKSGGAHIFVFTKTFVPAIVMRAKLKMIASAIGYARAEIYPKQDYINIARGDTGSFLNLPYFQGNKTTRYAFTDEGKAATLEEFYGLVHKAKTTISLVKVERPQSEFSDGPPCIETLAAEKIMEGGRNAALFHFAVFAKKKWKNWKEKVSWFHENYMIGELDQTEIDIIKKQHEKKDWGY